MNRIDQLFAGLKKQGRMALIGLVGSSKPPYASSLELADVWGEAGADILMVGVPTPFPWMEGETLQVNQRNALTNGLLPLDALATIGELRRRYPQLPLLALTMCSGVSYQGVDKFVDQLIRSGADGIDLPDYPRITMDDPWGLVGILLDNGLHFINPVGFNLTQAPTGTPEASMLYKLVQSASGFMFIMAHKGGTSGGKGELPWDSLQESISRVREVQQEVGNATPIVAVCGITTEDEVAAFHHDLGFDGVMVGSAVIRKVLAGESMPAVRDYIKRLVRATY